MSLTMIEYKVLNIMPRGAGYPVTTRNICKATQLSEREVRGAISDLISLYGVPIVANRSGRNTGMFIATDAAELNIGIASYKTQVTTMNARIKAIERANLDGWQLALKPDIKRLEAQSRHVQGA
ncbi:prophage P3 protein 11, DNA replication [Lactobacillus plantarum WCFS1] [Lactiplantibacillus mudanjiangensis]|uniref:DNA replication protein n=1 Tax=Lactiplantibacillus mudanjiangensis TaxID=1296538 RepID=UPI001013FE6D|nr:DNA replication protein [Lactiplantibacillus mudanjiangensis]VDG31336.1 prophage P3 protein 11, DNA replication [Lactobacillus plantarum WCFS1] [Lactiplantibacillus mudanjiangensis]